jgi:DNA replication and repair protein RecF
MTLDHFRSYEHLSLSLEPGLTLIAGANGSGKSNLLEAMYILAAMRSPRASTEGELIGWEAPAPPVARLEAKARRGESDVTVEIALLARTSPQGDIVPSKSGAPLSSKRIRLNGIAKRASEVVGQIGAVLFTTLDIEILTGSPSNRRRYLDMTIAQTDRTYVREFSRYEKAVTQRNALLKRIGEGRADSAELVPWDDNVATGGAVIIAARAEAVRELGALAVEHHRAVAASDPQYAQTLELTYLPALGDAGLPAVPDQTAVEERIRAAFSAMRGREIGAGTTLVGPHRDEMTITLRDKSVSAYGSRAQQRSVALALRLAEADLLRRRTGESPVLLLDDVFSELDPERRSATALALGDAEQVIVTTADEGVLPSELSEPVARYRVEEGALRSY